MNDNYKNILSGSYSDIDPNLPIPISQEDVEVECNNKILKGNGRIELSLLPSLSLQIQIDFPKIEQEDILKLAFTSEGKIHIPKRNISAETIFSGGLFGSNKPLKLTAIIKKSPLLTKSRKKISYIIFYLLNYWDFIGSKSFTHKMKNGNRFFLKTDEWNITIESLPTTSEREVFLKKHGGYGITHIGKIEKADNKVFTSRMAEDILEALFYILSFSRGFWVHPVLPIGYSRKQEKIWELWGSYMVSPWKSVLTWCDYNHISFLSEIFTGFMKRWNDPNYNETIKAAIYWYIRSNIQTVGTDGSIILTQAAIERLSWDYYVNIKKSLSLNGFEKLPASDRIKLILSQAGIPLIVPKTLKELVSISKKHNFDGPSIFTNVRNRIVHPGRKKGKIDIADIPFFECWNLGLWYLELLLLSIFEYNGDYLNRLKLGRRVIEKIPWHAGP